MSSIVLTPFTNERVFSLQIQGMANVLYSLRLNVEEWLNASGSQWELEGANRGWEHNGGLQIWSPYWDMMKRVPIELPRARFYIEDPDVAMMFKLTWA